MPSSTSNEKRTVVRGLGEIAFRANNLDAMQQFYEHVIGLPLITPRQRDIAGRGRNAAGYGAITPRARFSGDHPRGLFAFVASGSKRSGAEGGRFANWTQTDPN